MRQNKKQSAVSLALLLAMLTASVVSCGGSANEPAVTEAGTAADTTPVTEAVTEDPALRDSLPEADLGGTEFRMTVFGTDINRPQTYVDAQDGNIVNDAVYSKIRTVEERFNVDIVLTDMSFLEENHVGALTKAIQAGEDSCDLAQGHDVNMANAAMMRFMVILHCDTTVSELPEIPPMSAEKTRLIKVEATVSKITGRAK